MNKFLFSALITLLMLPLASDAQGCQITEVNVASQGCEDYFFFVSVDLVVDTPTSPGFTIAGNGTIYGTFLYTDLPVTIGPFLGDGESVYSFIAWDVENPECQNFTTLEASDCGPVCNFSNARFNIAECVSLLSAIVEFDVDVENPPSPAFDLYYEDGDLINSYLYTSLPVTIPFFEVSGANPIVITMCDQQNEYCCETFTLDALDCNKNNCEIYNVSVEPECTGGNFLVHLDFDFTNVGSDSFTLNGNNLTYGTFGYNELPVTLGPLNGGTNLNWIFVIRDKELTSCVYEYVLGQYNCPPPCRIDSIIADPLLCNGNEAYSLFLEFDIEGEGDTGFSVLSPTRYYGTFEYDDLPITIPSFEASGSIVDWVSICDNENTGCCSTLPFEALLCSGCIIYNIHAIPQPCSEEDFFSVLIDFDYQNVSSEGFSVSGNGEEYGEFSYEDVPILIDSFPGNGTQFLEFVIADLVNPDCFDAIEIGVLGCEDICEISNLIVDPGQCTGNNTYSVFVNFDFENVLGVGFDLFANGEFFGFFNYDDLPLTIEEFPASGNDLDTITVQENDNPDCFATLVFEAPGDCECHIFEATAEHTGCTTDSTFGISLEFFYENLPGDFVDVFFDGVFLGFYSVLDLPLAINNIPEGDGTGVLTVCANDLLSCCANVVIEKVQCTVECEINELFAEKGECTSDSTYLVDIVFDHENFPSDSVAIYANGDLLGHYHLNPDFIRIENFPVLPENFTEITVCALGDPDCCASYTFETQNCTDCHISDLIADPGICTSDSTYSLVIVYNGLNIPGESVTVFANGNMIGVFIDPDHHIEIDQFPQFETNHTALTVCSTENPDCCDVYEFETLICDDECHITGLVAVPQDCQSDTSFILLLEYNNQNVPGDSVVVTGNGNIIGTFHDPDGHIIIEHFPQYETDHTVITVCSVTNPDCCDVFEFETPDCGNECHIFDLVAGVGDCLTDSTFLVEINFEYSDLPTDSVIISTNEGSIIGQFHVNNGHIIIEHFPLPTSNHTVIRVCALEAPNCCDVVEFETPFCDDDCHITSLVADPGGCQSDTTYELVIEYNHFNVPGDSVTLTANGNFIGLFVDDDGHLVIPDFPVYGTNHTVITLCSFAFPDCCDTYEFETPHCVEGCVIFDLFAETGECTSDSTFLVDIVFEENDLGGDSVDIFANDIFLGEYFNHPDFIRIEDFPLLDGETTLITVCATEHPDCCDTYEIENPSCPDSCAIFGIEVDLLDCNSDSTFGVVISFDYEDISAGGFDVYGNGQYLGFYNFDQLPVVTDDFPSNLDGQYIVTICESDNPECCASFEFDGPICALCDISNLSYTLTPCDSAGNFYFILDFDFQQVGDDGFTVVGNGNNYGTFPYDSVPIYIGPFETNNTVYEFLVADAGNLACFDVIEPGIVQCSTVAVNPVEHEDIFQVFNNGSVPSIIALENISFTLFNSNGKLLFRDKLLTDGNSYEMQGIPSGVYIGTVLHNGRMWPVKLVKNIY